MSNDQGQGFLRRTVRETLSFPSGTADGDTAYLLPLDPRLGPGSDYAGRNDVSSPGEGNEARSEIAAAGGYRSTPELPWKLGEVNRGTSSREGGAFS